MPSQPIISQESPRSLHDGATPYGRSVQVIKNYCLEFCQLLFDGKSFPLTWDPDGDKTEIQIVDKHAFNLDQVSANPAIVANRGPLAWQKRGGVGRKQAESLRTGTRLYTDLVRGAVTLSCFAKEGLFAEDIAGFLFEAFNAFETTLRAVTNRGRTVPHGLGFFQVEAVTLGEEALVRTGARPELSVVPVAVAATVQRRWSTTPRTTRPLEELTTRTRLGP